MPQIFIVLELIQGGELFDKIVREGKFNEELARFYFRQLVEGVKYCHNNGVCHRDLKPENLLLDEHGLLKISDFGLSALYNSTDESNSRQTVRERLLVGLLCFTCDSHTVAPLPSLSSCSCCTQPVAHPTTLPQRC